MSDEVDFLHADKHESLLQIDRDMKLIFLQVNFNTLGIKGFLQGGTIIIDGHDQAFSKYKFARSQKRS